LVEVELSKTFVVLVVAVVCFGAGMLSYVFKMRLATTAEEVRQTELAREFAAKVRAETVVPTESRVPRGDHFAAALEKFGLSHEEAALAAAAAQRAFNLRQVKAGNTITVGRSLDGDLREIDYKIDADRMLKIMPVAKQASGGAPPNDASAGSAGAGPANAQAGSAVAAETTAAGNVGTAGKPGQAGAATVGGFTAEVSEIPSQTEVAVVTGHVEDSLFNAVAQAGESPEIAMRLAQIFGYDMDFYTDPRRGDVFHVVLEKKKYRNGKTAGYGKIFAAEYDNGGKKYQALLFHDEFGKPGYYTADGKSLQKAFLRSPLKFAAPVTSHFSAARYHPILKVVRPHLGTDYGAPIGTPVQAIGSGKVLFAGLRGGEGNMVHIAHANGYETMYLHLSKMFVRTGEHVEIGKTIGLVGMTGLATGPHLDFRILQKGQYKNFERLGLPPSDPVAKKHWPEFAALREQYLPLLKRPELLQAGVTAAAR
jgi:murein DD-endopeptidase MepM/ murein hydrolase activator NlpD